MIGLVGLVGLAGMVGLVGLVGHGGRMVAAASWDPFLLRLRGPVKLPEYCFRARFSPHTAHGPTFRITVAFLGGTLLSHTQ